jgi:hypothetical protein
LEGLLVGEYFAICRRCIVAVYHAKQAILMESVDAELAVKYINELLKDK